MSTVIPSSDAMPGAPGHHNLFDSDQNAWFHIDILNNRYDVGFHQGTSGCDTDGILIIRSTGHGPQGSLAIIEWTVQRVGYWGSDSAPLPHVAPTFALARGTGFAPSLPWWDLTPPAHDVWVPTPFSTFGPPTLPSAGMVLLGWRIVSL